LIRILPLLLLIGISFGNAAQADDYSIDFERQGPAAGFEKSDWLAYDVDDVAWVGGEERASIDPDVAHGGHQSLRIFFPKSAVGPSQGGHQAAIRLTPADEYTLSYWLRFSADFSWGGTDKGGKLPGLAQGDNCSGGMICDGSNGFTARYMWRDDGAAVLYLYHMDRPGKWGDDVVLRSPAGEALFFEPDTWIHLKQRVRINTDNQANGEVQIWFNGVEALSLSGLRFVNDGSKVDTFYISTFHGGNSPGWGPLNDSNIWIDDIRISK